MALAACQTAQPTATGATSDEAHALYARLTETVKTCWFAGDPAFVAYIYSPEINANAPRILIVPKQEPHGRPVLVIEPKAAANADVYGPLLASPAGDRVRADLGRWLKGTSDCV
jgi:hypothetical protein